MQQPVAATCRIVCLGLYGDNIYRYMTGDHRRTQLLIQRTFPAPKECFLVMPLHQINLKDDSSQRCFRCRFDKPGSLPSLVFSEVLPCYGLFQLSVVVPLFFNSQKELVLKSDWPGVPIFPAHDKRDPWGRLALYAKTNELRMRAMIN